MRYRKTVMATFLRKKGDYFILFECSRYLDQIQTITDCSRFEDGSYYPGEWAHYGVYANNHIIDVISHQKPVIRNLSKNIFSAPRFLDGLMKK